MSVNAEGGREQILTTVPERHIDQALYICIYSFKLEKSVTPLKIIISEPSLFRMNGL